MDSCYSLCYNYCVYLYIYASYEKFDCYKEENGVITVAKNE